MAEILVLNWKKRPTYFVTLVFDKRPEVCLKLGLRGVASQFGPLHNVCLAITQTWLLYGLQFFFFFLVSIMFENKENPIKPVCCALFFSDDIGKSNIMCLQATKIGNLVLCVVLKRATRIQVYQPKNHWISFRNKFFIFSWILMWFCFLWWISLDVH